MSLMPDQERRHPDAQPEWARRMERKLDTLVASLAEQDDEEGRDLEGNPLPRERDLNEPL